MRRGRLLAGIVVALAASACSASAQTAPWLAGPLAGAGLFGAPLPTASATAQAPGTVPAGNVRFGPRHAVAQLPCRPGDAPETGLQGQVPPGDVASGRAAQGYRC